MLGIERALPREYQFDAAAQELREELVDFIEDGRQAGDIIDSEAEFSRPVEKFWALSHVLAATCKSESEDLTAVHVAMYRGASFALQVVDDIKPGPIRQISLDSIADIAADEDVAETVQLQVQEYLSEHPEIDGLLGRFMPDIDTTNLYNHHTETAAGLLFMLCERSVAEQYIQQRMGQVSMRDIDFD